MAKILLIDDDNNLREVVRFILVEAGHQVIEAADGRTGIHHFDEHMPDLVLTDIRMPSPDGMEVLAHVRRSARTPPVPVIVLTAYGTVEQAVAAMQGGAHTYLLKPFNRDELRLTVQRAVQARRLEAENRNLRDLLHQQQRTLPILYASPLMADLVRQVRRIAASDATVLITGESGSGKELIARALHDLSPRWDAPFVTVNCGAIPGELMESELFGHVKGAFTGAGQAAAGRIRSAAGGSLILDEIAELPLPLQPKLLRVLESKNVDPVGAGKPVPVDFRLICATNQDLRAATRAGRFREDLFFRIDVVRLEVPPLRERPEDVPLLWEHFTRKHDETGEVRSSAGLLQELTNLSWPGNVRELRNLNQRLVLMRRSDTLSETDLTLAATAGVSPAGRQASGAASAQPDAQALPLTELPPDGFSLADLEKEVIRRALQECGGNKSKAAAFLRIPRHVLIYRLQKYDL